jgi:1-aminocyclopropane-1-carboxylate deaminase
MVAATTQILTSPIQLDLRREDLSHPLYGGNKLRKLKYNLLKAKENNYETLLTFGGAWSNHIYATAAACKEHDFKSIGVIRGEEPKVYSDTLSFARECGMKFHFISRQEYREKHEDYFKAWLRDQHGSLYMIPEGGSNYLGMQGCMEILSASDKTDYSHIACAAGTGATVAGLLISAGDHQKILAFSALKDGAFLKDEIRTFVYYALGDEESADELMGQLEVITDFDEGGYAKCSDRELEFLRRFNNQYDIKLDAVYTGKMMLGLHQMIGENAFAEGSKILAIHTGGLQGNVGIEKRMGSALFS